MLHFECMLLALLLQIPQITAITLLQHPAICEFPSKEFYEGNLETDSSVKRRHVPWNLANFWPRYRGKEWPIVFCQVEGKEENGHIGSRGNSKVDSQSKFNVTEAKKIVSKNTAF